MCLALFIAPRPAAPTCGRAAPGFVDSEHAMREFPEERRENYVHNVQLVKRLGRTEDIASAVRFLCSDEASFITAETLLYQPSHQLTRHPGLDPGSRCLGRARRKAGPRIKSGVTDMGYCIGRLVLFAGSDEGGDNWAVIATLIECCKLNTVNPHEWPTKTLTRLAKGHPANRVGELMPWTAVP